MWALVTGASSGIGYEMAKVLSNKGYDLILVARRENKLIELKNSINTETKIVVKDLSDMNQVKELYEEVKAYNISILINNAGFGKYGYFDEMGASDLFGMIDLNVKSLTYLMELFLPDMIERNEGRILNVASAAAFTYGPKMAVYYATKHYVYELSLAVMEELRRKKSKVRVSVLCPGPVKTEFDQVANVSFSVKALSKEYVAAYTIKKFLKGKQIIIPGSSLRLGKFSTHFVSDKNLAKIGFHFQDKKDK